jgi:hypothetical protein
MTIYRLAIATTAREPVSLSAYIGETEFSIIG